MSYDLIALRDDPVLVRQRKEINLIIIDGLRPCHGVHIKSVATETVFTLLFRCRAEKQDLIFALGH